MAKIKGKFLRWKREARATGLARVTQRYRHPYLYWGDDTVACVTQNYKLDGYRWMIYVKGSTPNRVSKQVFATEDDAKIDCFLTVKEELEAAG